jgi:hypothetical protein
MKFGKTLFLVLGIFLIMALLPGCFGCNPKEEKEEEPQPFGVGASMSPSLTIVGSPITYDVEIINHGTEDLIINEVELTWWHHAPSDGSMTEDKSKAIKFNDRNGQFIFLEPGQRQQIYQGEQSFDRVGVWSLNIHLDTNHGQKSHSADVTIEAKSD